MSTPGPRLRATGPRAEVAPASSIRRSWNPPAAALAAHAPAPAPSDALLDAAGAARLLNVPKSWVESQARQERIPCRRLGHYVRFDRDDLLVWSEARSVGPRPPVDLGARTPRTERS